MENNKNVKGSTEPKKKSGYNFKSIVEAGKQYSSTYHSARIFLRDLGIT